MRIDALEKFNNGKKFQIKNTLKSPSSGGVGEALI